MLDTLHQIPVTELRTGLTLYDRGAQYAVTDVQHDACSTKGVHVKVKNVDTKREASWCYDRHVLVIIGSQFAHTL